MWTRVTHPICWRMSSRTLVRTLAHMVSGQTQRSAQGAKNATCPFLSMLRKRGPTDLASASNGTVTMHARRCSSRVNQKLARGRPTDWGKCEDALPQFITD